MSIESVRKRLAEATPGPWAWAAGGGTAFVQTKNPSPVYPRNIAVLSPSDRDLKDSWLIAHAPTDLALLLAVAEAAKRLAQQLPSAYWPEKLAEDDADLRLVAAIGALERAD